jgi:urease accessory protein UreF
MTNPTGPEGQDAHGAGKQAPDKRPLSSGNARMTATERILQRNREREAVVKATREMQARETMRAQQEKEEAQQQQQEQQEQRQQEQGQMRMWETLTRTATTLTQEWTQAQAKPAPTGRQPGSTIRPVNQADVAAVRREVTEPKAAQRQAQSQERAGQDPRGPGL